MLGGKRKSGTPLAGACLGGDIGHTLLLGIIGLRHSWIKFVWAYRTYALVLKIYVGLCVESLLETACTHQRCRTPYAVHVAHLVGNLNPCISRVEFLAWSLLGKKRHQILGSQRLMSGRIEHRARFYRHLGQHIIPCGRYIFLRQKNFFWFHRVLIIVGG